MIGENLMNGNFLLVPIWFKTKPIKNDHQKFSAGILTKLEQKKKL
jgi:hypothetical protein